MKAITLSILAVTLTFSACGGDDSTDAGSDADVMFAQMMIPHHEQAIELADIALDPSVGASPAITDLASQIKGAQDPEIDEMTSLLESWGEPTYLDSSIDHSSMMDGMVSFSDMETLSGLTGTEFDRAWLTAMIAHHEGAIKMAEEALAEGDDAAIADLADRIIGGQTEEITTMKELLGG